MQALLLLQEQCYYYMYNSIFFPHICCFHGLDFGGRAATSTEL